MSFVAPIELAPDERSRLAAMASRPLLPAVIVVAVLTVLRLPGSVDSDVAWQLWIAGRLHAGTRLYRDIIEVNPPLWFWMALPIDRIATALQVRAEAVLITAVGCFAAASLTATSRLLDLAPSRRSMLLAFAALALLGISWVHIGQREQIVLIATLPYAALIAARRDGKRVPGALAMLIGLMGGVGFALKHYFLIVPALLELWLLAGQGKNWRWRRPEALAIAAVGALYLMAVVTWAPAFLTDIVPLVRLSYGMLGAPSVIALFGPFAVVGLLMLGVLAAHAKGLGNGRAPFASTLFVAAVGFACVYFVQAKGWIYHSIPLLGCASVAIAALLAESRAPLRLLRLAGPALLALPLILTVQEQLHPSLPNSELEDAISGVKPGESVGFLSVETAVPWSVTLQRRFSYPSRYMGFWMLNAIVHNEITGNRDPRLARLGQQVVRDTVEDFACTPPRRIIVARPLPGQPGFDILPFFLRNARFAELLSHYRVVRRTSFEVYERISPLAPATAPCSARA